MRMELTWKTNVSLWSSLLQVLVEVGNVVTVPKVRRIFVENLEVITFYLSFSR